MKSIGIDIGSYRIKVAEMESQSKTISLTGYREYPLKPEPGKDSTLLRVEILRQIVSQLDLRTTKITVALRQDTVSLRHRVFPFKERHKLLRALPFELEDEVPFDAGDALFDAKVVRYSENGSEVLAAVVPKPSIQETLNLFFECGIDPDILSSEGFGLCNILESWGDPPPIQSGPPLESKGDIVEPPSQIPARMLIDIGHTRTLLITAHDGRVVNIRTIFFGGHDIIEAVRKKYDLPWSEALKSVEETSFVLTHSDGATNDQKIFSDTISSTLHRLMEEIRLSVLSIRSDFNLQVQQVGLLGGVSSLINLAPYVTQQLELPANTLSYTTQIPSTTIKLTVTEERRAAVAIGLALEGLKKPRNPAINFRKGEFAKESESYGVFWDRWKHAAQIAAVAVVCFYVFAYFKEDFAIKAEETAQEAMIKQAKIGTGLKGAQLTLSGIQRHISTERKKLSDRQQLVEMKSLNSVIDVIEDLSRRLPSRENVNLDVSRLLILEENMSIEGRVSRRDDLSKVKSSLESLAKDGKLTSLKPSRADRSSVLTFAYDLKVNRRRSDLARGPM